MIKEQIKQFFATKKSEPKVMNMNGKSLKLANLDKEQRDYIMKRLAEKDEIANKGIHGILPGLKIDGKIVTKDNIKDFEIKSVVIKPVEKPVLKKYTEKELYAMNKAQQTEMLNKLGESKIPLLESDRIKKILGLQ